MTEKKLQQRTAQLRQLIIDSLKELEVLQAACIHAWIDVENEDGLMGYNKKCTICGKHQECGNPSHY